MLLNIFHNFFLNFHIKIISARWRWSSVRSRVTGMGFLLFFSWENVYSHTYGNLIILKYFAAIFLIYENDGKSWKKEKVIVWMNFWEYLVTVSLLFPFDCYKYKIFNSIFQLTSFWTLKPCEIVARTKCDPRAGSCQPLF